MKKLIKILKIGKGLGINIPKAMLDSMEITSINKVEIEYDFKKKQIIIKKEK